MGLRKTGDAAGHRIVIVVAQNFSLSFPKGTSEQNQCCSEFFSFLFQKEIRNIILATCCGRRTVEVFSDTSYLFLGSKRIKAIDAAVQAIQEAKLQGILLSTKQKTQLETLADQLGAISIQPNFLPQSAAPHPIPSRGGIQVQVSLLSSETVWHVKHKVVSLQPKWVYGLKVVLAEGNGTFLEDSQRLQDVASEGRVHVTLIVDENWKRFGDYT